MTAEALVALAEAAFSAVEQIITTYKNAKGGTVDPATALAAITSLQQALAANNAAADAAVAAKFPSAPSAP